MAEHQPAGPKPSRVALWCAPRTTSTALAKCLSAIEGMKVYPYELFSYTSSFRGYFLTSTGRDLPAEFAGNEAVYAEANDKWEEKMGYRVTPKLLSYQEIKKELENASDQYVLLKDMAAQFGDPKYIPEGYKHVFLIRDPSRVFVSLRKIAVPMFLEKDVIKSEADLDIIRDDPLDWQPLTWFEKQHELWKYVKANIDPNPLVIDTSDILSKPGPAIKALCEAVGFPYSDKLLELKPTSEIPKNYVLAAEAIFKDAFGFYERAFTSTHYVASQNHEPIPRDQLTDDVIRCVDHSMPFYSEMFATKLVIP